jgi:hypothetical protein
MGLKENVIIGKLIPARSPIDLPPRPIVEEIEAPRHLLEGDDLDDLDILEAEEEESIDMTLDDEDEDAVPDDADLAAILEEDS